MLNYTELTLTFPDLESEGMDYKKIIAESWAYTQTSKKLIRWFAFLPAIFTTFVAVLMLAYQFFSFKESYLFGNEKEGFLFEVLKFIWAFLQDHLSWTVPMVVVAAIFGFIYFFYPTLARAAAIQVIARNRNGQKTSLATGIKFGIKSFLPMIEYRAAVKVFTWTFILVEMAFVLRYSLDFFFLLLPIFILLFVVGLVMSLLFTYADFYIVIDDEGVFSAMKKSTRLVVTNLRHTFLITLLMIMIGMRIVLQVVLVFLVPVLVLLITGYLSIILAPGISVIIGAILGAVTLIVAAYLNAIVDIFSYTVWTYTFLTLTSEKEVSAREVFTDEA